jgi:DNA polymerase I
LRTLLNIRNLQNLPSGSTFSKLIKACFISPPGWLFGGADFNALEAVCEALLSQDPNKQKIYTDGYDSHCFNTFHYFRDQLSGIIDTVASINSIKKLFGKLRQKSKAPTFALQYSGTWYTIMKSAGVSKEEAQSIENNYKETYKISLKWLKDFLDLAHDTGYIEGCFGLRIRTPLLKRALKSSYKMPREVAAERRSAGNAKTQSYGMLNSRAANEFMQRVWSSPYRLDIMPCAQIHDAAYFTWRDSIEVTTWVNKNLIECMQWQELPELQHEQIKLGAELDVYWPCWNDAMTLPNNIGKEEIVQLAAKHKYKLSPAGIAEAKAKADEWKEAA